MLKTSLFDVKNTVYDRPLLQKRHLKVLSSEMDPAEIRLIR